MAIQQKTCILGGMIPFQIPAKKEDGVHGRTRA